MPRAYLFRAYVVFFFLKKTGPHLNNIYVPQQLLVTGDHHQQHQQKKKKEHHQQQTTAPRTATYVEQCFRIVKGLGSGAFGEVLQVVDVENEREYALKRSRRLFATARDRLRQLREVQNLDALPPHANMVQLHMAFEEKVGLVCLRN
jgi:serine/threonine protein kinase